MTVPATEAPDGYTVRVATVEDADALADLINDVNLAEVGFPWTTPAEVRGDLTAPDRNPDDDVVLLDADGGIAGYLTVSSDVEDGVRTANALAWVRPDLWGRGLSAWLLELGERRIGSTRAEGERCLIHLACWAGNDRAHRLFDGLGYARARTFLELRRDLTEPTAARAPDGIELRGFDPATDARPTHAALVEAFADHWGRPLDPFDRWIHHHIEGPGASFDPDLWFVALDGDQLVGAICTRAEFQSAQATASVDLLGVRRAWRGRGIARALLLRTFEAVRRRGIGAIELGVDATNPTGATRLYESVGMRVIRSFEIWERTLI